MNMFEANMRKVSDSLYNAVRLAAEYGGEETKELKQYTEMVEKLCETESLMNSHTKALAEASREQTIDSFDRRYNAGKTNKKVQVKGHKRYKDFVQFAKPLLDPASADISDQQQQPASDEELIMEDDPSSMIDPILKKPLEVPVRNMVCNHVYEKSSIEQLLKMNANTRCPVVGCAAQGPVSAQFLKLDEQLVRKLRRLRDADR
uniref:E3 SUMO-protein ligase NSE2 n=1 Tax=Anopheles braziliensis TaxID=58242 RepID=A0A2M3ZCB6_9DIPT